MHSHVVLYKTNPNNPNAANLIRQKAKWLLGGLCSTQGGSIAFHVADIPPPTRSVQGHDFQVVLNFIFPNEETYEWYMNHEIHREFVRFVLWGWRLKGDLEPGADNRFISHVLYASPNDPPKEWERNDRPEHEVVWAGELVIDA